MNKEDLFILVLALLLLAAMIYTFLFGGQTSKHGVSFLLNNKSFNISHSLRKNHFDLCQGIPSYNRVTCLYGHKSRLI
jgi:hypothetical protein